jgi:hypothetical protein
MKKLIIIIALAFSFSAVNAQTQNQIKVNEFLESHEISFNKGQLPVLNSNFEALIDSLNRANISYCRSTFEFVGSEISEPHMIGGAGEAFMKEIKKPFIYYRVIYTIDGITLEVIDGNPYL